MKREDLVASANGIMPPEASLLVEFSCNREVMASEVNSLMSSRPDLEHLVGPGGKRMSEDNNRNFPLFMESLMAQFRGEVFVDTVLWAFRAYRRHGFQTLYWPANLSAWMETLKQHLSPEAFKAISPFYVWLITHIPIFVELTDAAVPSGERDETRESDHGMVNEIAGGMTGV